MKPAVSHHHCLFKTLGEDTRLYSYATQTEAPAQQVLGNKIVRTRSRLFHIFSNSGRNSLYRISLHRSSCTLAHRSVLVSSSCLLALAWYHTYINVYVQTHSPVIILPIQLVNALPPYYKKCTVPSKLPPRHRKSLRLCCARVIPCPFPTRVTPPKCLGGACPSTQVSSNVYRWNTMYRDIHIWWFWTLTVPPSFVRMPSHKCWPIRRAFCFRGGHGRCGMYCRQCTRERICRMLPCRLWTTSICYYLPPHRPVLPVSDSFRTWPMCIADSRCSVTILRYVAVQCGTYFLALLCKNISLFLLLWI